jgi:Uma2 family endonuclease
MARWQPVSLEHRLREHLTPRYDGGNSLAEYRMIATPPQLPLLGTQAGFRQFSVPEYHKLIEIGLLTEDDNLELLEGYLVKKIPRNPPHDWVIQRVNRLFYAALRPGWELRVQSAITLAESEPEPDITCAKGDFRLNHPRSTDIGALIEVSDSTLSGDRIDKGRIYGRASIPVYWIINLIDRQIKVYEQPTGATPVPGFAKTTIYKPGDSIPLVLESVIVTTFQVDDLLP